MGVPLLPCRQAASMAPRKLHLGAVRLLRSMVVARAVPASRSSVLAPCSGRLFASEVPGVERVSDSQKLCPRPPPSAKTKRVAEALINLDAEDLKELRALCKDRLIAKPAGKKGSVPKNYDPSLPVRRSDRPMPVRSVLRGVGQRFPSIHPYYLFAGSGAGVMPVPEPPLSQAIMAPHMAEMMSDFQSAMPNVAAAPVAAAEPAAAPAPAEELAVNEESEPVQAKKEEPLKPTVSLRLLGFEASKKLTVVKTVRAFLGEGLKESKEMVERAPVLLKKGVLRADAEAQAEKLRAAGAEVALE